MKARFSWLFFSVVFCAAGAPRIPVSPRAFEPNRGQSPKATDFSGHLGKQALFFADGGTIAFASAGQPLRIQLLGANSMSHAVGLNPLPGVSNYFIGRDPGNWIRNVPHYARVRYSQVYRGIDLVYYFQNGDLESDFVIGPGADGSRIRFRVKGADRLRLDANGDLLIETGSGILREKKPALYQMVRGRKAEVSGGYVLYDNAEFSFRIGKYNAAATLTIDPVFSTYLGGSGNDQPVSMAADAQGNAYVTGVTTSANFPVKGALQSTYKGNQDVFVTKLDANTGAIIYSTYIGGSDQDVPNQIKVDAKGNAYVIGSTSSKDFPALKGVQTTLLGPVGAFVIKLNPAGNGLLYGSFLSGSLGAVGRGIDVDFSGDAYVVGATASSDFPLNGARLGPGGGIDAFIAKLTSDGTSLLYSSILGGSGTEYLNSIAVNSLGEANVVGWTNSPNLPTNPAISRWTNLSGNTNGWMAKIDPYGLQLEYISYYGGRLDDIATWIAADPSDDYTVYIGGLASSPDFPTPTGAPLNVAAGAALPYVAKFLLPGADGQEARPAARPAFKADDYSWLKPGPDDCEAGPDWEIIIEQLKIDQEDLREFSEVVTTIAIGLGEWALEKPPVVSIPTAIILYLIHVHERNCKAHIREGPGPELEDPTSSTGPLFAVSGVDGSPVLVPQPPVSATADSPVQALAADGNGNIYVAIQTSDSSFPVSSSGMPSASSSPTGYITKLAAAPSSAPTIRAVSNAFGGSGIIAPNTWVSIYGSNLAPANDSRVWQGSDFVNNQMATVLDGVSVTMNGINAYVYYISPGQLDILTPPNLPSGAVQVIVSISTFVGKLASSAFTVQADQISPSLFVFGAGPYVTATHTSYTDVGPTTLYPGLTTPAAPGETIIVYANGFGPTTTPIVAGSPMQSGSLATFPTVQIGGVQANVSFAGLTSPGLYQLNVQIPSTVPAGDQTIVVEYQGASTQSGVLVAVQ